MNYVATLKGMTMNSATVLMTSHTQHHELFRNTEGQPLPIRRPVVDGSGVELLPGAPTTTATTTRPPAGQPDALDAQVAALRLQLVRPPPPCSQMAALGCSWYHLPLSLPPPVLSPAAAHDVTYTAGRGATPSARNRRRIAFAPTAAAQP
jgi:hypothetical protein